MKTAIKIISMVLVTLTLLTTSVAGAFAYGVVLEEQTNIYASNPPLTNNAKDKKYGEEWLEIAGWGEGGELGPYYYQALYEYYEEEPETAESTPDCVLIFACHPLVESPWDYSIVVGRHYYYHDANSPYDTVYCIYLPKEGRVISLKEAYEEKIPGIESCLEHTRADLFGDMDFDDKLSVKDATYIQKCLVGLEKYKNAHYIGEHEVNNTDGIMYNVADFNRDDAVNVKDATAIQKHIAGLEV